MNNSILIKNIYYMLSYAFQSLNQYDDEKIIKEEFDNTLNMFAAVLYHGMALQLKHGIYREYMSIRKDIPVMHGKINIQNTVKNRIQNKQLLSCEYDELSENNMFNRILKSTVLHLIKSSDVKNEYRELLKKQMLYFSEVEETDLHSVKWSELVFHRNNQSYRMLIGVCQLISEGMLQRADETGEYRLTKFADDQLMSRLYEKFLLEYFRKHFPELNVSSKQVAWALDSGTGSMLPSMLTDITIELGNMVLIIDAKYYSHTTQVQYDRHTVHSANMYQIFAYVKNRDYEFGDEEHSVSGILLYARTDEEIQPDEEYQISGNKISVKTLDLNTEFSDISSQLNLIVYNEFMK